MNASTKQRTELSVIPKGHWRNVYHSPRRWIGADTGRVLGPGEWLGFNPYPSREVAEERGHRWIEREAVPGKAAHGTRYLGAKFFPDP